MEFSLDCPNDGAVEMGLEDITSIVFNGFETVDVVFVCPVCGTEIRVSASMPNLLITTLDLADVLERSMGSALSDLDISTEREETVVVEPGSQALSDDDEERIERYCEYFKRQLAGVDTVEAFLAEVDAP